MPAITGFMEHEYKTLVNEIVRDAIDHREDWIDDARQDGSAWKLTVNKRNMQVFRKKHAESVSPSTSSSSSLYTFLTVGYLSTTIDDLHAALHAPTSHDDQILHSLVLENEFLTSHVLQTLRDPRPSLDPQLPDYFGIKYIKLRMPGSRLGVHPRDSVYLEYLTLREDKVLVRVVYSIDDYLSPPSATGGVYRATLRDVWLFVPAPNGKIQVVAKTFHDMKGSSPKYFSDQSALSFWRVYDKLTSLSYVRRLLSVKEAGGVGRGSMSSLARSMPITRSSIHRATVQSTSRSHCECCRRKFTLFHSKRYTCHNCSMTMCSNCHLRVQYSVQTDEDDAISIEKLHATPMTTHYDDFCLACIHRSKETFKDFDKVDTPAQDVEAWEAAQAEAHKAHAAKLKQAATNAKPVKTTYTDDRGSEFELRLSKEDQTPVMEGHMDGGSGHHATPERISELHEACPGDEHVFEEMRKSIAIQESILSAMRASWHGHTEQEKYVQTRQSAQFKPRRSEYNFDRDSDRFEEVVE
ncbi:Aste57867_25344 [Aphanomyces stellatus]|uniref:Aste57867_25344 protein n=1 Tax=Aphanomyces stellatus TaxID=120398 RepID=A0A485LT09_9STRA|nr:hypothetical protein As57867_025266 [Aphanomyces stellatus]VFU01969.1 Aste57867_25344 [Aphanomyces stellatus]